MDGTFSEIHMEAAVSDDVAGEWETDHVAESQKRNMGTNVVSRGRTSLEEDPIVESRRPSTSKGGLRASASHESIRERTPGLEASESTPNPSRRATSLTAPAAQGASFLSTKRRRSPRRVRPQKHVRFSVDDVETQQATVSGRRQKPCSTLVRG